jgi:hypothetical protein
MEFCHTDLPNCFVMKWRAQSARLSLVSVNLAPAPAAFQLRDLEPGWEIRSLLADADSTCHWSGAVLQNDLAPHGFLLLELRRITQ